MIITPWSYQNLHTDLNTEFYCTLKREGMKKFNKWDEQHQRRQETKRKQSGKWGEEHMYIQRDGDRGTLILKDTEKEKKGKRHTHTQSKKS